jgi:hypothetical protein
VKYAAGTETSSTMTVEADATIREVFSQFRNRVSESTVPKVDSCHCRGRNVVGVCSTSLLGRSESRSMTA